MMLIIHVNLPKIYMDPNKLLMIIIIYIIDSYALGFELQPV